IQQATLGRRGKTGDPLYGIRKTLRTGNDYLTEKQRTKLTGVFENTDHAPVQQTWQVYQQIIAAYRHPNRAQAKQDLIAVIDSINTGVSNQLTELQTLGRTMKRRADDILADFDLARSSNGSTDAINDRIDHLRGTALGFRNLLHYIAGALLDTDVFRTHVRSFLRSAASVPY